MLDMTASRDALRSHLFIKYFASARVFMSFLCESLIIAGSVCSAFHTCWFMLSINSAKRFIYKKVTNLTHLRQITIKSRILVIIYLNLTGIHFRILESDVKMYVNLDHIAGIAEAYRAEQLRKDLTVRLQGLKLDNSYRSYRDDVLKGINSLALDSLRIVNNRLEYIAKGLDAMRAPLPAKGPVPQERAEAMHQVTKGLREMVYVVKTRPPVKQGMKLEDRAKQWINGTDFNPCEIANFVNKDAQKYRSTRRAELTLVSHKNYDEMLKIEDEVAAKYGIAVDFFKAMSDASAKDSKGKLLTPKTKEYERAKNIEYCISLMKAGRDETSVEKGKISMHIAELERSMKPQRALMPTP